MLDKRADPSIMVMSSETGLLAVEGFTMYIYAIRRRMTLRDEVDSLGAAVQMVLYRMGRERTTYVVIQDGEVLLTVLPTEDNAGCRLLFRDGSIRVASNIRVRQERTIGIYDGCTFSLVEPIYSESVEYA